MTLPRPCICCNGESLLFSSENQLNYKLLFRIQMSGTDSLYRETRVRFRSRIVYFAFFLVQSQVTKYFASGIRKICKYLPTLPTGRQGRLSNFSTEKLCLRLHKNEEDWSSPVFLNSRFCDPTETLRYLTLGKPTVFPFLPPRGNKCFPDPLLVRFSVGELVVIARALLAYANRALAITMTLQRIEL